MERRQHQKTCWRRIRRRLKQGYSYEDALAPRSPRSQQALDRAKAVSADIRERNRTRNLCDIAQGLAYIREMFSKPEPSRVLSEEEERRYRQSDADTIVLDVLRNGIRMQRSMDEYTYIASRGGDRSYPPIGDSFKANTEDEYFHRLRWLYIEACRRTRYYQAEEWYPGRPDIPEYQGEEYRPPTWYDREVWDVEEREDRLFRRIKEATGTHWSKSAYEELVSLGLDPGYPPCSKPPWVGKDDLDYFSRVHWCFGIWRAERFKSQREGIWTRALDPNPEMEQPLPESDPS